MKSLNSFISHFIKHTPIALILSLVILSFFFFRNSYADACSEIPSSWTPLGNPGGCDVCRHFLLPGKVDLNSETKYYIICDLPERFRTTGVLYATVPILPDNGTPLSLRTQIYSDGFKQIDNDFDVFVFHTSVPGDGSHPRRLVVYALNEGTGDIQIAPRQIMITDGKVGNIHEMETTLGRRVLASQWDEIIPPLHLKPGTGDIIAYSKQFSIIANSDDKSQNVNCFGRVRAAIKNAKHNTNPTAVSVFIAAIPADDDLSKNKTLAESHLTSGALQAEESFDMTTPPTGCDLRRATGVFRSFQWRNEHFTIDVDALTTQGRKFQMALPLMQSGSCPAARQTSNLILRPGYTREDTLGNYMVDYRVSLRLINKNEHQERKIDIKFGHESDDIGLAWQVAVRSNILYDKEVDNLSVRCGFAGKNQPGKERSFLEFDGGPVTLKPCEGRTVSLHFLILGNSSLPFQIHVIPVPQ